MNSRLTAHAQALLPAAPQVTVTLRPGTASSETSASAQHITLDEAIRRAEQFEPQFAAARAAGQLAQLDRMIARNALLPNVVYHNQYLYTQGNGESTRTLQGPGTTPSPRFVANNAVHEYVSQATVNEAFGLQQTAALQQAAAAAARASAETEVARRGLVGTVVALFYGDIVAQRKRTIAENALREAAAFTALTTKREQGREGAHADVVKAQLLEQTRERELADATLASARAHLEIAVLLFDDPHTFFEVIGDADDQPLPTRVAVDAAASQGNPEFRSALAALRESDAAVLGARAAYLPDVGLNFTYGIDAPQFALKGPLIDAATHVQNLGYSASVVLDIPVWDWLSTDKRIKQSEIRRQVTKIALTAAERRLVVQLDEVYSEAQAALLQLSSLAASVDTARESLRLTQLRYEAGEASVLEVVDAQASVVTAENAKADGNFRAQSARAELLALTGSL